MPSILLLEDDKNFCGLIEDVLTEDEFFEVTTAFHPEQAIEIAQLNQFDLLIADVRMAGSVDGIGASEAILKLQPRIYRIIMTGYTDDEAPPRAMNQGVDYYLYKPFKLEKLINAAKSVLQTQLDHSTYQHKLSTIYRSAKGFLSFLQGSQNEPEKRTLDQARLAFHKSYFAGMQAGNLTVNAALSIWNDLIPVELQYEQLSQIIGPATESLASSYLHLQSTAEKYARTRSMGDGAKKVTMLSFSPLYGRVKDLTLSFAEYMMAPSIYLWLQSKETLPLQTDFNQEAMLLFGFTELPKKGT